MKSGFDFQSLPVQMILGFVLVVALTAAAAGLPAIWLINDQLNRQTWSQMEQGGRAVQALYQARANELVSFAMLTSQRPTLQDLAQANDRVGLVEYLDTLRGGAGLDLLAVCDPSHQLTALSGNIAVDTACQFQDEVGYHILAGESQHDIWLAASWPVAASSLEGGKVVAGLLFNEALVIEMRQQTGLEHSLLVSGEVAASSLGEARATMKTRETIVDSPNTSKGAVHTQFNLGKDPYYALRMPLNADDSLQIELALPVAANVTARQRLIAIFAGSTLAAALLGSLLGVVLARRISQPLVGLATTARKMRSGDLATPIRVPARVREVAQLAEALERTRVDLLDTLTQLRKEKDWVDHLLASIVEGIVTLDDQGRITFFSRGAQRITGWERQEAIQRHCDDIFPLAERKGSFSDHIPPPGAQSKLLVNLPFGRQATLSFTGARLAPSEAGDAQTALVFRDVSESELVHRLLGDFIANVTHEFRTPLSALAASIELLEDQARDLSPEEVDELLKSLHLGIINLQTLVDNLLESANIESGHFHVNPRPYDLGSIIGDAVGTMQPLLDKYEQELALDLPAAFPTVIADPRRTVQVLVNLLSNASKYGPPGGDIEIRAQLKDGNVCIQVLDCGPGIPEADRPDLFRRFATSSSADSSAAVGMGLGLSVVKAIVEAQGGQVGVRNRAEKGAVFWFTLPVTQGL
jgi:two-component system sensor histidine kinase ResE